MERVQHIMVKTNCNTTDSFASHEKENVTTDFLKY